MSNRHNRATAAANQAEDAVQKFDKQYVRTESEVMDAEQIDKPEWPPAIPVSVEPEEGKPLMAWYDGAWHEAIYTKFWSQGEPDWRSHPAGAGISPTHYQLMPPAPEGTT